MCIASVGVAKHLSDFSQSDAAVVLPRIEVAERGQEVFICGFKRLQGIWARSLEEEKMAPTAVFVLLTSLVVLVRADVLTMSAESRNDPEELYPGDAYVTSSLLEAMTRVDRVINYTKKMHEDPDRVMTPEDFLDLFRHMSPGAQREARAAEIVENTIQLVAEKVKAHHRSKRMIEDLPAFSALISQQQLNTIASLSGCARSVTRVNCSSNCLSSKYRTIDGSCNNRENPLWGSSLTPFHRFLPPIYENQWNEPVGWNKTREYNGFTLPSVRHVSNRLMTTPTNVEDPDYTHMMTQWGQFLDHDTDLTATAVGRTMFSPMGTVTCGQTCDNIMPCFPIPIPDDDPRIDNERDRACMPFTRSSAVCGTGETSSLFNTIIAREQINQITSFIDASNVYGSTFEFAQSLRDFSTDDGLLRVQEGADISSGMDLLPFMNQAVTACNQDPNGGDIVPCFLAGDGRVNEVNTLIASHTIWLREHNRLARELKRINPHWNGEQIYQEARKIVGSEMQHITFAEYLPKILGPRGMDQMGDYTGYDPNVNPSTRNEFATAAFRFGHAAIGEFMRRFDENYEEAAIGNVALHDAFFSPWRVMRESGIDPVVRGLIGGFAKLVTPTQVMHEELSQNLFALRNQIALDLASLNTQRGRDHGIPFYNDWRVFCNLSRAASFDDLSGEISDSDVRDTLSDVYGDVNNIDLWPAAQLEDHEDGARVGPTFRCMLAEQFKLNRNGDRFWFESDGVLTASQRTEIRQVTYARVICDTTGITRLPPDVFRRTAVADMVACEDIPGINLQFWEEIPEDEPCGEPAEVEDAYVQKCGANFSDTHIYTCDDGYAMTGAGEIRCLGGRVDNPPPTCSDIDECARGDMNNCQELCVNSIGSFMCACPEGFMLNDDGVSCSIDDSLSLGWIIAILFIVLFFLAMCAMVFVLVKGWHTHHQNQEIQRIKQLNAKPIDRNGVDNKSFISDKHDKKSLTGTSSGDSGVLEEDLDSLPGVVS
ncbi:PREDICTED: thyroid peroxidase-like isoform X1 [Branchiostoma belcheri]|uniref:Thyroid peroxidase n=2 Tax=Branchiostoma belcheri TaxID=7741 RepID=A0A6P4ZNX8_BRABE|nr:PREDICTED: thyroid peroxidase-like isoform X1 [Branchiostoma belcheri]